MINVNVMIRMRIFRQGSNFNQFELNSGGSHVNNDTVDMK